MAGLLKVGSSIAGLLDLALQLVFGWGLDRRFTGAFLDPPGLLFGKSGRLFGKSGLLFGDPGLSSEDVE